MVACFAIAGPRAALADPVRFDPSRADAQIDEARRAGANAFCERPSWPLPPRARLLRRGAIDPELRGLREGMRPPREPKRETPSWLEALAKLLGPLARVVVYGAIALFLGFVGWLVVSAILRARRDRRGGRAGARAREGGARPPPSRRARARPRDAPPSRRRARGERRARTRGGAVPGRVAPGARSARRDPPRARSHERRVRPRVQRRREQGALREVVRAVDRVQFGGEKPTREAIAERRDARVVARARRGGGGDAPRGARPRRGVQPGAHARGRRSRRATSSSSRSSRSKGPTWRASRRRSRRCPCRRGGARAARRRRRGPRRARGRRARAPRGVGRGGGRLVLAGTPDAWPTDFGASWRGVGVERRDGRDPYAPSSDDATDDDRTASSSRTRRTRCTSRAARRSRGRRGAVLGKTRDGATWAARRR